MQRSASRSRFRHCLTQTLHKEGHRPSVELDDVVPDHPGVQLALREHGLAAHVEKRADALAVGQGEREQVRDDERLDVQQRHDPRGVGAAYDGPLGLAHGSTLVAVLHRFAGPRFAGSDAWNKKRRVDTASSSSAAAAAAAAAAEKGTPLDKSTGEQTSDKYTVIECLR